MNADSPALQWTLVKVAASGQRDEIQVRIGAPRYLTEPFPGWRCALFIQAHPAGEIVIIGATAMQAMSLALKMARDLLRGIAENVKLEEAETLEPVNLDTLSEDIH